MKKNSAKQIRKLFFFSFFHTSSIGDIQNSTKRFYCVCSTLLLILLQPQNKNKTKWIKKRDSDNKKYKTFEGNEIKFVIKNSFNFSRYHQCMYVKWKIWFHILISEIFRVPLFPSHIVKSKLPALLLC